MTQEQEWLGTTQAGRLLKVQPKTLKSWLKKNLMPNVRTRTTPTGRIQFKTEDIQKYADEINGERT